MEKKLIITILVLIPLYIFAYDYESIYQNNSNNEYKYEGLSGTKYKYDLSNPIDRMDYSLDLDAQMEDKLNLNPEINMDRDFGQFGGGAEEW